ncbi:hypothetical protein PFISCL1PPCAC_15079 [Pristionchus fissidentatus]|uniref:Uncharacterized protein n=1 Tax=Pristionchus fissidentatus TaxID=1538716 RepID=A0AAV5VVX8_9BILA|nr:hypothetical protein PFISCL1PPCAC_15079 [Pristionchus fissidentatus]
MRHRHGELGDLLKKDQLHMNDGGWNYFTRIFFIVMSQTRKFSAICCFAPREEPIETRYDWAVEIYRNLIISNDAIDDLTYKWMKGNKPQDLPVNDEEISRFGNYLLLKTRAFTPPAM